MSDTTTPAAPEPAEVEGDTPTDIPNVEPNSLGEVETDIPAVDPVFHEPDDMPADQTAADLGAHDGEAPA